MTLCDCFYYYYDLALGIAILKPVQYILTIYLQGSKITLRGQKSIWYIKIGKVIFLNKYKQPNKIFGTLCMYCIGLSIAIPWVK